MAHEIEDGAMFSTQKEWHHSQTGHAITEHALTTEEALVMAKANWLVLQAEVYFSNPNGEQVKVPNCKVNFRSDTNAVLDTVSEGYRIFQNHEVFGMLDDVIGEAGAWWETGACLKGGRRVFMLAAVPRVFHGSKDDEIKPYILAATSHDGSLAYTLGPTTTRVVCNNTLSLALSEKVERIIVYHTKNMALKIDGMKKQLGTVLNRFDSFQEELDALCRTSLTATKVLDYIKSVFPPPKKKVNEKKQESQKFLAENANLLDSIIEQQTQRKCVVAELLAGEEENSSRAQTTYQNLLDNILGRFEKHEFAETKGTAWAAVNAITAHVDHDGRTRGKDDNERRDNRQFNIMFGPGDEVKQLAYNNVLALAA